LIVNVLYIELLELHPFFLNSVFVVQEVQGYFILVQGN